VSGPFAQFGATPARQFTQVSGAVQLPLPVQTVESFAGIPKQIGNWQEFPTYPALQVQVLVATQVPFPEHAVESFLPKQTGTIGVYTEQFAVEYPELHTQVSTPTHVPFPEHTEEEAFAEIPKQTGY
jgi:hypothetical protein